MTGYTPIYNLPYPQASDLVSAYPGTGQDLAEEVETVLAAKAPLASPALTGTPTVNGVSIAGMSGLSLVSPSGVVNGTASGGQVTFSGVASVSLNGVFTSAYENYFIVFSGLSADALRTLNFRYRASGTDNATANYLSQYGYDSGTTVAASRSTGQTNGTLGYASNTSAGSMYTAVVCGPQTATVTTASSNGVYAFTGGADNVRYQSWFGATTQFDGISLIANAGTISGVIRVYGFKNS